MAARRPDRRSTQRGDGPPAGDPAAALCRMRNIGPYSARLLVEVGVRGPDELRALGAAGAFRRVLFARSGRVSTNLLWALEGAIADVRWDRLDDATRARLRSAVEDPDAR